MEPRRSVSVWAYVESPLRVLLVKRVPQRAGGWQPITGRVEEVDANFCAGGTLTSPLVAACVREIREETGLPAPLAVVDMHEESEFVGYDGVTYRQRAFAARYAEAHAPVVSEEHEDARWVDAAEARAMLRWDADRALLDALARRLGTE